MEVTLYSRQDCHLCHQAEEDLAAIQSVVPHTLVVVDVDSDPKLAKEYGFEVPVVVCGPYTLRAPFDRQLLEITLRSANHRQQQIDRIEEDLRTGVIKAPVSWTKSDGINYWLSRYWLWIFNLFILLYMGLPILAPVLMAAGAEAPAGLIYRVYGAACHQFAFRSFFLFGEQPYYPRSAAEMPGIETYEQASGHSEADLWTARSFVGNEQMGYKIALCERDVAIYGGILLFGVVFGLFQGKFPRLPWYVWLIIGVAPIGLDGFSQLFSQPPFNLIPYRESVPLLRSGTGFLFGFTTAWFGYPAAEDGMRETRDFMKAKLERFKQQTESAAAK